MLLFGISQGIELLNQRVDRLFQMHFLPGNQTQVIMLYVRTSMSQITGLREMSNGCEVRSVNGHTTYSS